MKKLSKVLSVICALVLVASLGVTAFAEYTPADNDNELSQETDTVTGSVKLKVNEGSKAATEYYVVVELDDLVFEYSEESEGEWDGSNMTNGVGDPAKWVTKDDTFTVKNQSNEKIWVAASYTPNGTDDDLTVEVKQSDDITDASEFKELARAQVQQSTNEVYNVHISGDPTLSQKGQEVEIGTITVKLSSTNPTP